MLQFETLFKAGFFRIPSQIDVLTTINGLPFHSNRGIHITQQF